MTTLSQIYVGLDKAKNSLIGFQDRCIRPLCHPTGIEMTFSSTNPVDPADPVILPRIRAACSQ